MIITSDAERSSTGGYGPIYLDTYGLDPSQNSLRQVLLRHLACVGTAGVLASNGLELSHIGTSPMIVDNRPIEEVFQPRFRVEPTSTYRDVLTLSVADQVRELLAALALNKSQLADVLGVSRPTLYDWFDGKEPNAANAERLEALLRLISRAGVTGTRPLNARFVRRPLRESGPSLLDALRLDPLDDGRIIDLLREARELTEGAASQRLEREERLRALGYEEPSDERRKQILAQNIALRDWPKT